MEIADGEHRALVMKALGRTEVQAYIVPRINDDIKRRLARQTLNKLQGEHDIKLDADEMALIFQAGQLNNLAELIAQGRESLENILTKHKGIMFQHEDNFDVDKALEDLVPETQLGDIWQLGSHRIICADCTDKRSIDRLLEDKQPDLLFTDPPYNVNYEYKSYSDDKETIDYSQFIENIINIPTDRMIATCGAFNIGLWDRIKHYDDIGLWHVSNCHSRGIISHFRTCEPILFYGKFDKRLDNFFDYPVASGAGVETHAPAKPMLLMTDLINSFTKEGEIILDPTLGSGSTMIACEQTNRICYGVEIDPHYVDVCVKRWEAFTNQKAVKLTESKE